MPKPTTDQVGRAGEHYVAAELNLRGAYASPFSGNVPGIDIVATGRGNERIAISRSRPSVRRVTGTWDCVMDGLRSLCLDVPRTGNVGKTARRDCVSPSPERKITTGSSCRCRKNGGQRYYIVRDDRVRKLLRDNHEAYLDKHDGQRAGKNHDSLHFSFSDKDLQPWLGRWNELGLCLEPEK